MLLSLLAIIGEGDNQAPDGVYNGLDLNNGGWILIGFLIAFTVIFIITTIYCAYKANLYKTSLKDHKFKTSEISEEEKEILNKYRDLKESDKNVIKQMLNSLDNKSDKE